jgi:hypothetical protein
LRETCKALQEQKIRLVFADANDAVRHELDVSGVTELVGQDAYLLDLRTALETYQQKMGTAASQS